VRRALIACAATTALLVAGAASAAPTLTNGNFETNTGNGQVAFNTTVAGWNVVPPGCSPTCLAAGTQSYTFVFNGDGPVSGSTADKTGANGFYGNVTFYGPGNGVANGFTADTLPGGGGAFVAADPAFQNAALQTTITGLTLGQTYQISFDWAAAQQVGFFGITTEGWHASIAGTTSSTSTATTPNMGFTPWANKTFTFTADGTSDVLSFLSFGGPSATQPPFALLDNVTVTPVPEPATWALMLVGVGALGAGLRMRRREVFAAA